MSFWVPQGFEGEKTNEYQDNFLKQYIQKKKEAWSDHYLAIVKITKLFPELKYEEDFVKLLDSELFKINKFYKLKEEELKKRVEKVLSQFKSQNTNNFLEFRKELLEISEQIVSLQDYAVLNRKAFRRIIADFEKYFEKNAQKEQTNGENTESDGTTLFQDYEEKIMNSHFSNSNVLTELESKIFDSIEFSTDEKLEQFNMKIKPQYLKSYEDFDLLKLKPFRFYKLWVPLIERSYGENLYIPVMVAKGAVDEKTPEKFPVLGITCAIHGNELNGIPLVHRLFKHLDLSKVIGTIVAVPIVNIMGYERWQRKFNDGIDLNRIMPGKKDGDCSEVYAYRFLNYIVKKFSYMVDLHTASFGRVNSLYVRCDMSDPVEKRMALLQNPQIILNNKTKSTTMRGAACAFGIKTITVEIGDPQVFQEDFIDGTLCGVFRLLEYFKMCHIPEDVKKIYDFKKANLGAVICSSSYWIYTDKGGILKVLPNCNTWVRKGEKIAVLKDAFGTTIKNYYAPEKGIVIGKSSNPVSQTGDRILHLGIVQLPEKRKHSKIALSPKVEIRKDSENFLFL